jgi:flavodoxin
MSLESKRILIAFFSKKGENYSAGGIVDLAKGNTEVVAGFIHRIVGGDLFEIIPAEPYPSGYKECTEAALREKNEGAEPALKTTKDVGPYDIVFLGYPNWWGTMPRPVFTFLENAGFSGKTIAPFCTNEGSGLGSSASDIRRLCPKAVVAPGLSIRGTDAGSSEAAVKLWIDSLE